MIWMDVALACGAFACDLSAGAPVVQTAERIAFGIDEDGWVEAHVQVAYEGSPEAFAWVVPIPADPEVFVSNDALFDALDQVAAPRFGFVDAGRSMCFDDVGIGCKGEAGAIDPIDVDPAPQGSTVAPVIVTDRGQTGPYDYVVLAGDQASDVTTWLSDQGFDLPSDLDARLAPYVVPGGRFLAVRLQKDADTGSIAPLGFRYPGGASIPIQLTAIAAADDLAIQVDVFGEVGAVPTNYLHAVPDLRAVDFENEGANYYDVVARAVDEAGGHAFVTVYAGPTTARLWTEQQQAALDLLYTADEHVAWLNAWEALQLTDNSTTRRAFQGFDELYVYVTEGGSFPAFDHRAFAEQLESEVVQTLRRADALVDRPFHTRMVTTLSPSEMTIDPTFALNPDRPWVPNLHGLTMAYDCNDDRRTAFLDGEPVPWPFAVAHANLRIERYTANGPAEVLVDNPLPAITTAAATSSSSCASPGGVRGGLLVALLAGLISLRRVRG